VHARRPRWYVNYDRRPYGWLPNDDRWPYQRRFTRPGRDVSDSSAYRCRDESSRNARASLHCRKSAPLKKIGRDLPRTRIGIEAGVDIAAGHGRKCVAAAVLTVRAAFERTSYLRLSRLEGGNSDSEVAEPTATDVGTP